MLKDKPNLVDACGTVYEVPCYGCTQVYIGETGRNLKTRINEHRNNVKFANEKSLIFQHSLNNNHKINFENTKILIKSSREKSRKFLESCFSKLNANSYNRSVDIPDVYLPLLNISISKWIFRLFLIFFVFKRTECKLFSQFQYLDRF